MLRIDVNKLRKNALAFKEKTNRFLYAVVKADAYGHGAVAVVNALYQVADAFAVALVSEAVAIKQVALGKEILIFTPPTSEDDVVVAANNGFTLTATDLKSANLIVSTVKRYGLTLDVEIKVNTGMNRYGVYGATLGKVCAVLKRSGQVRVQGVYSHLYSQDKSLCDEQRLRFMGGVKVCRRYFPLVRAHLSSTYGVTLGKEYLFDGVRIGLGLYGYFPGGSSPLPISPVMSGYATCVAGRKCLFGGVGYGEKREDLYGQSIAVLRGGYAEGLSLVAKDSGLKPPLVGNCCMDVCISRSAVPAGRETLLFKDVAPMAAARNTSVYEVLCLLGLRASKEYIND